MILLRLDEGLSNFPVLHLAQVDTGETSMLLDVGNDELGLLWTEGLEFPVGISKIIRAAESV